MIIVTAPVHPFLLDTLQQKGYQVLYEPAIDYNGLMQQIEQATGLIVSTRLPINQPLLQRATALQWIGRLGSGMELIDTAYAASKNIQCVSSPEGNRQAVAEHVLGMLLSLMNHIHTSAKQVENGQWLRSSNRGTELRGKTVGIVGFGNTGAAFAKLLSAFDVQVLAYDKYKSGFGHTYIQESTWDEVIAQSDVISFHVPLTPETTHMANAAFFHQLKRQPYLINAARGKVVHTISLVEALQTQRIRGVALDVLENESIDSLTDTERRDFEFLTSQSNVLITPHIAGYSHESYWLMGKILLEKLGLV